jgi:predicted deacylase
MNEQPTDRPTRLSATFDLGAPGRSSGHIGLVLSAGWQVEYGVIPVPVAVISNGDGPTVLLTAGTHGDEYEGQVLLQNLARQLTPEQITGRIIIMPALNVAAVLDSSRISPLDNGNLNRAYPGDPDGTPTYALADYLTRYVLPHCDYAADLHSGGKASEFVSCGFLTRMPHGRDTAAQAAALSAMGLPYTMVYDESTENRALDTACDQAGVVMVSTELSGAGTVNLQTLRAARQGLNRLLEHWGVLRDSGAPASTGTRFMDVNAANSSVMAPGTGLFEPVVGLGDEVQAGQIVGWLHSVDNLEIPSSPIHVEVDGTVVTRRVPPLVARGNFVMSIGQELDPSEL